jgi:hypothetical protein
MVNIWEKLYSIFVLALLTALVALFILAPQYRTLETLIPLSLLGLLANIIFMYIIFKDIYMRSFSTQNQKYIWFALILFIWPTVIFYLPRHGFKKR